MSGQPDVRGFCAELDIKLIGGSGENAGMRCPHPGAHRNGDKHPSASIHLGDGRWMCHVCQDGGRAFELARAMGWGSPDARELADRFGLWEEAPDGGNGSRLSGNGRFRPPVKPAKHPPRPMEPAPLSELELAVEDEHDGAAHLGVIDGATFALDEGERVNAVWGADSAVLWAEGEPLMIYGPDGVGKTSIAQQLVCARIGVRDPELFEFPVAPTKAKVLYLALDRPRQAGRSFRRMVEEKDRELLAERLVVKQGSLPFDIVRDPEALCQFVRQCGADTVVIDSTKDLTMKLSDEETGTAIHKSWQLCVEAGIEVLALHHPRKAQADNKKPKTLADVYGSRWITAGCGSVLLVWGDAGDPVVALEHLKQPVDIVGPLELLHNNRAGRTFVIDSNDVVRLVAVADEQPTAREVASSLFSNPKPTRNQVEQARRKLDAAVEDGALKAVTVTTRGGEGRGYIVASEKVHAKGPRTSTDNVHGEGPRGTLRSSAVVDPVHVHVHSGPRADDAALHETVRLRLVEDDGEQAKPSPDPPPSKPKDASGHMYERVASAIAAVLSDGEWHWSIAIKDQLAALDLSHGSAMLHQAKQHLADQGRPVETEPRSTGRGAAKWWRMTPAQLPLERPDPPSDPATPEGPLVKQARREYGGKK